MAVITRTNRANIRQDSKVPVFFGTPRAAAEWRRIFPSGIGGAPKGPGPALLEDTGYPVVPSETPATPLIPVIPGSPSTFNEEALGADCTPVSSRPSNATLVLSGEPGPFASVPQEPAVSVYTDVSLSTYTRPGGSLLVGLPPLTPLEFWLAFLGKDPLGVDPVPAGNYRLTLEIVSNDGPGFLQMRAYLRFVSSTTGIIFPDSTTFSIIPTSFISAPGVYNWNNASPAIPLPGGWLPATTRWCVLFSFRNLDVLAHTMTMTLQANTSVLETPAP